MPLRHVSTIEPDPCPALAWDMRDDFNLLLCPCVATWLSHFVPFLHPILTFANTLALTHLSLVDWYTTYGIGLFWCKEDRTSSGQLTRYSPRHLWFRMRLVDAVVHLSVSTNRA